MNTSNTEVKIPGQMSLLPREETELLLKVTVDHRTQRSCMHVESGDGLSDEVDFVTVLPLVSARRVLDHFDEAVALLRDRLSDITGPFPK